jgi:hypothetical protein
MTAASAFSPDNPNLQIAWDSTSLSNLMTCPRYYQLVNLKGWGGSKVDLEFGGFAASGFEYYQKARLAGMTREEAEVVGLTYLFKATWPDGGAMWGGSYQDQWRCEGDVPFKNAAGRRAKCPYSHKDGKGGFLWWPAPAPDVCSCGGTIQSQRNYVPGDKYKNRESLIRLFCWYVEDQPEAMDDGLKPYQFPDGRAAVELSFSMPLPFKAMGWDTEPELGGRPPVYGPYGPNFILCGHIDYIGDFGGELFVVDNKTTTKSLNQKFWDSYSPNVQFDTYDLAGNLLFPDLPIRGIMIDAASVGVTGASFGRHIYYKTEAQREEHLHTIEYWIRVAEQLVQTYGDKDWPMNKRSCWNCPFHGICDKDPKQRDMWLKANFTQHERWNPLQER